MNIANISIEQAGYENKKIIKDVHFTIKKGDFIGLIGPNGAGKSTTIKAMLGLLNNAKSVIEWEESHSRYAYVPERPVFYKELTLSEHLSIAASSFSLDEEEYMRRAPGLLKEFSMEGVQHDLLDSFSKGMQQKVMLIIALMIRPDLYIIDEPFIGLDPRATKTLLRLLEEERIRGAGVVMSTHVLDTAEKICDRFLLISNGELLASGTLSAIQKKAEITNGSLFDCFDVLTDGER